MDNHSINSVALSGDARWLVAGGSQGLVHIWDREHRDADLRFVKAGGTLWIGTMKASDLQGQGVRVRRAEPERNRVETVSQRRGLP